MKKRVLSMFMALALCLTLLPTAAFAEGEDVSISGGVIGGGETGGEGGGVLVPPGGSTGEGGGIYVPPGSTTEGTGGIYVSEGDTQTEIWCTSKPDSIGRAYDGTTDGSTIPIDLTFTDDGTNEIKLKEGTGFTATKTFDSADAGDHKVTVEIKLIDETAKQYKLKAGEEKFTIGGYINKAYPKLTVSLSKTACTVGEKILPLLSVEGAPEGAAVTYYYTQHKSIAGSSEYEGSEAMPAIDGNTAISDPGTYYVYAKTGGTKNYEEERSTPVELTVNEAVVEAASVTKEDGTDGGTYESLPAALNAAQDGDTVKLLANHVTDADALNALGEDFTFEQYASIVPVVTKTLTLDLNHKTVDYLEVGFSETNEATQEKETLATGNLTVTSEAAYGRILNLLFMAGALDIQSGEIGILVDDNGVESPDGGLVCDVNSGTATISNGMVYGLTVLEGAAVTVKNGFNHRGRWSVDSGGTLSITGGTFKDVQFVNSGTIAISGGTFEKISNNDTNTPQPLMSLLAKDCAFVNSDMQDGTKTSLTGVMVKEHTHTFENGKCACGVKAIVTDNNVNYYSTLQAALDAAANNASITSVTLGQDLTEDVTFNRSAAGALTLNMNGHKLEATAGVPLTVIGGELIIEGAGEINQNTASNATAFPAISLTGGSLVFEGDLTAQGGKYGNYDRQPAVKATGGTVEFKGALNLDGGLFLDSCARLASKLTQGRFYSDNNDQGQVYRVQIKDDYQHSYDLLADGYAFAEYDAATGKAKVDGNGNPVLVDAKLSSLRMNTDVIIVAHTHSVAADQEACACGRQFEAGIPADDGTITYYETIDEAFANVKENETVKLMIDSDDRSRFNTIYVIGGPYTFDLNGHKVGRRMGDDFKQAVLQVGAPDGNSGTLTVLDSSDAQTGYFYELELYNGSLTVESGSFYRYWESATTATGTMTFKGGTVDVFTVTSRNVETKISGGTFGLVENNIGGKPGDLLADNRAFFNRGNDSFVNGYDDRYQAVRDVVVKDHTHKIVDGSCECGFTCAHDWSDKNGVCKKTNCGYHCPHNAGAAEADGVWACNTCGQTVTAMVTAPNGAITYYADGYVGKNTKSGLYFAVQAAESGSTVTMLGGSDYPGCYVRGGKTLTLDVSNGKTISGTLNVGYTNPDDTRNTLIVRGSAEISYVIVDPGNTLDLTGWTGRIGSLTVQNGGNATLNGGTFANLNVNGAEAGSLLAPGYAFQNADSGAYVEHSSTANMENVKVVKCPHSDVTLKADLTGAKCKYCGASFAATLDDAPYSTIDAAVSAWLAKGGTLKLYVDYTAADGTWNIGSGSHTIDLNGHRMLVQGDGAFKPTNNMHLTVTDGTERGQIENILLDGSQHGSFTLESGYVCNLKMTDGAVVALKGGSVDNLDVQNSSANTNLSIQGGSIGKLNIKDWVEGMHVSATSGSLGAYSLPSGKILADVLDHQYYATGTSLDRQVDTAQNWEKFVIKKAPYDFGSTSKAAEVPINGRISFMVDSPSGDAGVYDVKWYRRTDSGAVHMTENRVAGVNVNDTLDVFCVITGMNRPNGEMQWQVAVKDYKINVVPADLSQGAVVFKQVGESMTGLNLMGNIRDGKGTFVFTPWGGDVNNASTLTYCFEVSHDGQKLIEGKDYTIESGNTAQYAGDHTLTIQGIGSYTGTATHTWRIEPYKLTRDSYTPPTITKVYDGTTGFDFSKAGNWGIFTENVDHRPNDEKTGKNPVLGSDTKPISIYLKPEDLKASAVTLDSPDAGDRTASFTIELKTRDGQREPNFVFEDGEPPTIQVTAPAYITKAFLSSSPEAGELNVANDHAGVYTLDLAALLPALEAPREYGAVTYGAPAVNLPSGYYAVSTAKIENGKLILPIQAVKTDKTGSIGSVQVKVSTTNYHDFTLTINVNATNKIIPTGEPTLSAKTLTYGQALSAIKLSGKLHDNVNNKDVEGTFTWANGTVKPSAGSYEAAWKFTPTDGATYAETTGTVSITVNKAKPTGDPTYTRITAANKTLKDAALKPNTSWPTGTIQWVDKDGKVLPDTTEVKANTEYTWSFTPADTANYNGATGELTLYSVSTGGGGGGGSSSGSTVKTDTTTKPDGTKVQTETRADGTKIQTETKKDGSTVKTTTNPNGSSVTESKDAAGSTGTVKTDKNGQTEAKTALSSKAIEDAKKSGEPVKAPVEVKATRDSDTAPTVKVELPKGAGETKVEIPVSNVKPGTVAVLVHADGTEEIVKNSLPTEDGIQLTVNGGATVKIVDNSKDFADTRNHWAKDAIDFVSARGLVNGMNESTFSPNAPTTRAQLWTILARQNDANLNGGSVWYEKAQLWSKDKGISDGTNPNGTINRAQMVTMLWRTMGQPAATDKVSFADVPAGSYYAQAVAWAVESGITAGVGGGRFDPTATCTRAQIAAFLARSMK